MILPIFQRNLTVSIITVPDSGSYGCWSGWQEMYVSVIWENWWKSNQSHQQEVGTHRSSTEPKDASSGCWPLKVPFLEMNPIGLELAPPYPLPLLSESRFPATYPYNQYIPFCTMTSVSMWTRTSHNEDGNRAFHWHFRTPTFNIALTPQRTQSTDTGVLISP
jgi:hypothetical protein